MQSNSKHQYSYNEFVVYNHILLSVYKNQSQIGIKKGRLVPPRNFTLIKDYFHFCVTMPFSAGGSGLGQAALPL